MSADKGFCIGDTVKITLTVYVDDVLTSPTAVVFTVWEPDMTVTTFAATTATSEGLYKFTYVTDQLGYHRWRAEGNAPASFAREGSFYVYGQVFPIPPQPET